MKELKLYSFTELSKDVRNMVIERDGNEVSTNEWEDEAKNKCIAMLKEFGVEGDEDDFFYFDKYRWIVGLNKCFESLDFYRMAKAVRNGILYKYHIKAIDGMIFPALDEAYKRISCINSVTNAGGRKMFIEWENEDDITYREKSAIRHIMISFLGQLYDKCIEIIGEEKKNELICRLESRGEIYTENGNIVTID